MKLVSKTDAASSMLTALNHLDEVTRENAGVLYLLAVAARQQEGEGPSNDQAAALMTVAGAMGTRMSDAVSAAQEANAGFALEATERQLAELASEGQGRGPRGSGGAARGNRLRAVS